MGGHASTLDDVTDRLYSDLRRIYCGAGSKDIERFVANVARNNSYNPVLDMISSIQWDGRSRINDLCTLMRLDDDDALSKTLVFKWLLQTVAMLFNENDAPAGKQPFGAEFVLCLTSPRQGIGKTSLLRAMALQNEWFKEGASIDDRDKDTVRRCITTWITELGELESTMKSDISKLKAFITQSYDEYRLPYGHADVARVRHTSLAATCNSTKFLLDPTGNRRFGTV